MKTASYSFSKELIIPTGIQYLNDVPEFYGFDTNTIIHKTVPGIGATYNEIKSSRNSIIVLPNISIIRDKHIQHKDSDNTFAVHGEVSIAHIKSYLNKPGKRKFLSTPNGLKKIVKALGQNNTKDYFLLVDECHRLIQDGKYRKDMLEAMELFFEFDNKALISATPLPFSDPRFTKQNFKHVLIKPELDRKLPITLYHTNSVLKTLGDHMRGSSADGFCIFFDSIKGIVNIIEKLKIKNDSNIFCSEVSQLLLKLRELKRVHTVFEDTAKFNFFTSSFFNGLDVKIDNSKKIDVIIISDVRAVKHSLIDPFTDTIQIAGRLRRSDNFNLIHINNSSVWIPGESLEEAQKRLSDSEMIYKAVNTLRNATILKDLQGKLDALLTHESPYSHLIFNRNFSNFLYDNFFDDVRVSSYYSRPRNLYSAYESTKRFILHDERSHYSRAEVEFITNRLLKYRKSNIKMVLEALKELSVYEGTDDYRVGLNKIKRNFSLIVEAYEQIGVTEIENLQFNIKKIKRKLFQMKVEEKKIHYPLIQLVHQEFHLLRKYLYSETKEKLQNLADSLGLEIKMVGTDIRNYFQVKEVNVSIEGRSNSGFILTHRKLENADNLS